MDTVKLALESQLKFIRIRNWCWIAKGGFVGSKNRGEWKQFVGHRVNEILKLRNKEY